jgi:hypothetical protein
MRRETWVVRHDASPEPIEFSYPDEDAARAAYDKHKFYDPATGWGVTLVHRILEVEVLATTKPKKS